MEKTKTAFITGASRGIGRAIALNLAKQGYSIAIAAKTTDPQPNLPGTIYTVAKEIEALGSKALPLQVDIRFEEEVKKAIDETVRVLGGIDILINNASAINLMPTEFIPMKRYDLLHDINVRGTFMVSRYSIPHLKKSENPHILTLSPPLNLDPKWFGKHLAYTMSKYGMSMTVLGLSQELRKQGIAVNALWPKTTIGTSAVRNMMGGESIVESSRKPEIMADAASIILHKKSTDCTGNFFIDEDVLRENGVTDFGAYAVNPDKTLIPDLFL